MHIVNYDPKWSHKTAFFPNFTQSLSTHTSTSKSNSNSENNLMLEKSPYSTMDFSKLNLEVWRNLQIQKNTNIVWIWTENNFSLEKSPNSTFSLEKSPSSGKKQRKYLSLEFSKLNQNRGHWVWRNLQTQIIFFVFPEFGEFSPNSKVEFGCFLCFSWVWRFLQTQRLSLEISHSEGRCFASNWGWVLKLGLAYRSSLWFHPCLRNDRVSRWVLCGRGGAFAPEYVCIHFSFYEIMFL